MRLLPLLFSLALLALPTVNLPAQAPVSVSAAKAEFDQVFAKISSKLQAGQRTERQLTGEIAALDALIAKYAATQADDAAGMALVKARLYLEVFEQEEKGLALLRQIKADFPKSPVISKIDQAIAALEQQAATRAKLAVGQPFPAFSEKDIEGRTLSLGSYKGSVVLIDFWATWCGPCVAELPNLQAAYKKYHGRGFEIVGISLDQNQQALTSFVKKHQMTWAHYFDGKGWQNKLAQEYGIDSIPATFLLDRNGVIVAKGLRGAALDKKLEELLK
ncbi:MAG: TlpA family protein disulfide reductase [Opitutaceae bacterium]|nr:TlpA family protein disulfide reductase [Opitutaceae bacterium]